ncbi:MAG: hypothetical protein Q7T20_14220, partial [Saprospiraceae bacterium]|nr:hypothetical protein [Saprospiraceae bacterium]
TLVILSFAILPIAWYATVVPQWQGNLVVKGMLDNKETASKLLDYFWHNLISTLPELLLNYGSVVFFLAGFYFLFKRQSFKDPRFILILALSIIVLIYYLFEANAIAKNHDYYFFPFFPLLFMLVAYGAYNLFISKINYLRYFTIVILLLLPVICHLGMRVRWNPDSPRFNKDLLIYKSALQNAVPKDALVVAGNDESHFIFFYYIDKKGWGFDNDNLTPQMLKTMIEKGAKYLYTDSRIIDKNQEIVSYLDKLILEKGTIKIYSLKK